MIELDYRAAVGPAKDYDKIAAITFNLLTMKFGLREHHKLLDIGCGSLRIGRLLIPYLNHKRYFGYEPNTALVMEGLEKEVGHELRNTKSATLWCGKNFPSGTGLRFNYILAQSIFSHTAPDLLKGWMDAAAKHLAPDGRFVATFKEGKHDCDTYGWIYPNCVTYRPETMEAHAARAGLAFKLIDWEHPRQQWCLMTLPKGKP
jgi:cyclopropane fatty-acyl-phospholipid synthase-like methyltransferase